jgi:hypothetical protein
VAGSPGPKGDPQTPSDSNPLIDGTAAPGTSALYSRGDHVHPTDTTRAALTQVVRYDAAQGLTANQQAQARQNISAPLRGQLAGLTLSTAGSSATFGIAAGEAADSTAAVLMQLTSAYTKTTVAWAVGTGNGALANGTFYHVFLIKRLDTGQVDALISLSPTAPTLPANYTLFRRIGSMRTGPTAQWVKFLQIGDKFLWDPPVTDVANAAIGAGGAGVIAITVPPGVVVTALFNAVATSAAAANFYLFSSPLVSGNTANNPSGNISMVGQTANVLTGGTFAIESNTANQIMVSSGAAATGFYLATLGWTDSRGRNL